MEQISRRNFLVASAAAIGGYALSGCGSPEHEQLPDANANTISRIDGPATAHAQAERLNPPPPPRPPQTWQPGQFVRSASIGYNGMALNYDDGPSPYNTDPILRTLAKYGIKATFFVIGVNVIAWPEILRRIVNEGHEIGNHSHTHSPYAAASLAAQIPVNQQIIHNTVGIYPVANRAPGLTRGQIILNTCKQYGLYEAHTTIDSLDWRSPRIPAHSIANNVLGPLHPGAMPLQHDGGNGRPTPAAQEAIIQGASAKGYVFNTVTGLINTGAPSPGTFTYASNLEVAQNLDDGAYVDVCNYDPETELKQRLGDTDLKYAEKMRINEALLQLEEAKRD